MNRTLLNAALMILLSSIGLAADAQGPGGRGGPGYGAGYQARQAASASDAASGAATTPMPRRGMRGQVGPNATPGWALMTPQERTEHRSQMRAAKTYDECLALVGAHMAKMAERAQAQGKTLPGPRREPCIGLKP